MTAGDTFTVGVDLGGTKVRAGIAGRDGLLLSERREPTVPGGGRALVTQIAALAAALAADSGATAVAAVGLGGAGVPDESGSFDHAPNLGDVATYSFRAALEDAIGCPVVLDNDANVAALGELVAGVGREHRNFAVLTVGTGIGMGLVLDGMLVRGAGNAAGEIGYLPIGADPTDPAHHRRGPLEEMVAGDVLARRVAPGIDAVEVFARAGAGDDRAVAAIDEEARWIAHAIVAVEAVAAPGRYVLGGGIGSRTELLTRVLAWTARLGRDDLPVAISRLGSAAPVLGALRLAADTAHLRAPAHPTREPESAREDVPA